MSRLDKTNVLKHEQIAQATTIDNKRLGLLLRRGYRRKWHEITKSSKIIQRAREQQTDKNLLRQIKNRGQILRY